MADLNAVFEQLRRILLPYAATLATKSDNSTDLHLDAPPLQKDRKPMFFAAVKINKSHVSFHLMPVYVDPSLLENISPRLKRRMDGKACFNFTAVESPLFEELAALTQAGFAKYQERGFV